MTNTEAKELTAVLMASFPQIMARLRPGDAVATLEAYAAHLVDLEVGVATAAVKRLSASATFLPTVGEIRSAVFEMLHGKARAGGDAWGDVQRAIGAVGMNRTPRFDDPLVERCVQAMGWRELCLSRFPVADRARFIQLYAEFAESRRVEGTVAGIAGASVRELPSGDGLLRDLSMRLAAAKKAS